MTLADPGTFGGSFVRVVWDVLRLDRRSFEELQGVPGGLWVALGIVLLAGLSGALGQSIVLFANRIKPRRMLASLLLSSLFFVVGFAFLTLSISLVGDYLFARSSSLAEMALVVGLGYAPRMFSFFTLTPYFGVVLNVILSLWSLLAVVTGVSLALGLGLSQAAVCGGLGWLLIQVTRRTVGWPIVWISRSLQRSAAGVPFDRQALKGSQPSRPGSLQQDALSRPDKVGRGSRRS